MHNLSHPNWRRALQTLCAAAALLATHSAGAQGYPTKPIRVLINSAPGGLTDVVGRLVANRMSLALGQPLVIDNRIGAGGLVGAEAVVRAQPDGYTIGVVGNAITSAPFLMTTAPFDASSDFAPVALLMSSPLVLVTSASSPYQSLQQYIAEAKSRPGGISFASGGNATMGHLLAEQLQALAGVKLIHVPYKGGAPALNDVLAGHVPVFFDTLATSAKLVQENRLRSLAIASPKRSPVMPAVPTLAESGYPEVQGMGWYAIVAPAGTPREIVARLNEEANKALNAPEVRERIASIGGTVEGGEPAVLSTLIQSEMPRWSKLVRERGIKQ